MTFVQHIFTGSDHLERAELYGDRDAARLAIVSAQSAWYESHNVAQRARARSLQMRAESVLAATTPAVAR